MFCNRVALETQYALMGFVQSRTKVVNLSLNLLFVFI